MLEGDERMTLSEVVFPRMFEPIAHVLAIAVTGTILADAIFEGSYFKPVFFCYALSGLYCISVVYEGVWALRRGSRK